MRKPTLERKAHRLKGNKTTEHPRHCVFVDTETIGTDIGDNKQHHNVVYGYAIYTRLDKGKHPADKSTCDFTDSATFWKWLFNLGRPKQKIWVFAHNIGFDFTVLGGFKSLRSAGFYQQKAILECPPTVITFHDWRGAHCQWNPNITKPASGKVIWNGNCIQFVDSINYFQMSLADLGESIGIPKLDMPYQIGDNPETKVYCKRDVKVLQTAILRWINFIVTNDLGAFRISLASQSMAAFTHRFMNQPIYIHINRIGIELERMGYYGGRVECFRLGKLNGPLYMLDVNSMYPSVMVKHGYPTNHITSRRRPSVNWLLEQLQSNAAMANVSISTTRNLYPIRSGGKLVFPIGEFRTTLSTPELITAFDHDEIREVHSAAIYETAPIFNAFVEYFYAERQKRKASGNSAEDFLFKIILNALYGKFGQKGNYWTEVNIEPLFHTGVWNSIDADTGVIRKFRSIDGRVQEKQSEGEAYNAFPAIAAHVTAYARLVLDSYMGIAGTGNYFYCDTDSILVNQSGYNHLKPHLDNTALGGLKLETVADTGYLYGCKDYILGNETKIKGISKSAIRIGVATYQQPHFWTFRKQLQAGVLDRQIIETVTKTLKRNYDKANVDANGAVTPFVFTL